MLRDDALDIRDTAFLTNIEKRIMIMNNIILDEIDPLDIKDKEKLRLPQLRKNIYHYEIFIIQIKKAVVVLRCLYKLYRYKAT